MLLSISAWLGPLALYVATMRRCVDFWDTGEMQTVPWILGIAHPTGFPTFVIGGFLFSHLVPIGSVAFRMSLFCGLAMSGAAGLTYVAARELRVQPVVACGGAWLFATSLLAWSRGTRTEVHALAIFASAGVLTLALRYARRGAARILPWLALVMALGIGVHPVVVFACMPAVAIVAGELAKQRGELAEQATRQRGAVGELAKQRGAMGELAKQATRGSAGAGRGRGACAASEPAARVGRRVAAGLAVAPALYAYLPLRSAWLAARRTDPTLALGIPPGRPYWDYDHPAAWSGFVREVTGSDFTVGSGLAALANPASYLHIPQAFLVPVQADLGSAVLFFALIGLSVLPRVLSGFATCALLCGGLLVVVFATSYSSESDVARYFLLADWLIVVFATLGIQAACDLVRPGRYWRWSKTAGRSAVQRIPQFLLRGRRNAWVFAAAALSIMLTQAIVSHGPVFTAQAHDLGAEPFIARVARLTPPHAIIIAMWSYATPLGYASYVDKQLGDRIIETSWPADDAAFIPQWFRSRPIVIVNGGGALPATVSAVMPLDAGTPQLLLVTKVTAHD